MTRVLHVVLSLESGGTERLVIDMANRLLSRGVDVHVCCLDAAGGLASMLDSRATLHVITRPPHFSLAVAWRLASLARHIDADVIHCHQYTPFVYGCVARAFAPGLGLVFTEHGRLFGATTPSLKRRRVNRLLTHVGGLQFAVSHELRRFLLLEGFAAHRLRVIHNGVEPLRPSSGSDAADARQRLAVAPDAFVVGTSARFDAVKDLPTLIEAAALVRERVPQMALVLMGDGPDRPALMQAAKARGLNMVLPGHVPNVRALLPALDVYVNCSLSEGISIALLEAMDAGVPVVATEVGGTPEIVRDDIDGLLVPARSPAAVAEKIMRLAGDANLRGRLGKAARHRVEEAFSAADMLEQYVDAYRGASSRRHPPTSKRVG